MRRFPSPRSWRGWHCEAMTGDVRDVAARHEDKVKTCRGRSQAVSATSGPLSKPLYCRPHLTRLDFVEPPSPTSWRGICAASSRSLPRCLQTVAATGEGFLSLFLQPATSSGQTCRLLATSPTSRTFPPRLRPSFAPPPAGSGAWRRPCGRVRRRGPAAAA